MPSRTHKGEFKLEQYRDFQRHLESKGYRLPAGFARAIYLNGLWDSSVAAYIERRGKRSVIKWQSRHSYAQCLAYAQYRKAIEANTRRVIVNPEDYALMLHVTGMRDADVKRFLNGLPSQFIRRGRIGDKRSAYLYRECLRYAAYLRDSGQLPAAGVRSFARGIHSTGSHDAQIAQWRSRQIARELVYESMRAAFDEAAAEASGVCPDCGGAGFYYPAGYDAGLVVCHHPKLTPEQGRIASESVYVQLSSDVQSRGVDDLPELGRIVRLLSSAQSKTPDEVIASMQIPARDRARLRQYVRLQG